MIIRRYFDQSEIEDAACRLLREYAMKQNTLISAPVDVDLIGETVCGLCFDWDYMPEVLDTRPELAQVLSDEEIKNTVILGGLYPRERRVVLNEKHIESYKKHPGRERFTKAHEIGHWVLHIDKGLLEHASLFEELEANEPSETIICRSGDKSSLEWQANAFAAALLMPKDLFLEVAAPLHLGTWQAQYELRDLFNVTISTLVIRLNQLGLTYVDNIGKIHRSEAEARGQIRLK